MTSAISTNSKREPGGHRPIDGATFLDPRMCVAVDVSLRLYRQREHVEREQDREMDSRIDQTCLAPAELGYEQRREWPADRAGKAPEQGQSRNCRASPLAVESAKHGEGRIVEACAHATNDPIKFLRFRKHDGFGLVALSFGLAALVTVSGTKAHGANLKDRGTLLRLLFQLRNKTG